MRLPSWIPETPRSWVYEEEWLAMSRAERQWSFIIDVAIIVGALSIIWLLS